MPGAISMAAVFFVTIVEMIFTRGHMCGGDHAGPVLDEERGAGKRGLRGGKKNRGAVDVDTISEEGSYDESAIGGVEQPGFGMAGNRRSRSHSMSRGLRALAEQQTQAYSEKDVIVNNTGTSNSGQVPISIPNIFNRGLEQEVTENRGDDRVILTPEQVHKRALLQCALLEMGILFHSVFIGMALSVTGGPGFVVLLLAIIFHRMLPPTSP